MEPKVGPLGPPPTMPRSTSFTPSCGKVGRNRRGLRRRDSNSGDKYGSDVPLNEALLAAHGVDLGEGACVKAGDVLTVARPFVRALATACRGQRCENCFEVRPLPTSCPKCNFPKYCSVGCLEEDVPEHSDECIYLSRKRFGGPSSDTVRFAWRIVLRMQSPRGGQACDVVPGDPRPRRFQDLVDHFDDVTLRSPGRLQMADHCYREILSLMGEADAPDPDFFMECYGRMAVNSFGILDADTFSECIGSACYLGPSIMDHSCSPNAVVAFGGHAAAGRKDVLVVRATEDIPSRDFRRDVRISYIDTFESTPRRQESLLKAYYFLCRCPRCLRPEVVVGAAPGDVQGLRCGRVSANPEVSDYHETLEAVQHQMGQPAISLDTAKLCLTLMDRAGIADSHLLRGRVEEVVFECLVEEALEQLGTTLCSGTRRRRLPDPDLATEALDYGLKTLQAYERFDLQKRPKYGLTLMYLAQLEFGMDRTEAARARARSALAHLSVSGSTTLQVQRLHLILNAPIVDGPGREILYEDINGSPGPQDGLFG